MNRKIGQKLKSPEVTSELRKNFKNSVTKKVPHDEVDKHSWFCILDIINA